MDSTTFIAVASIVTAGITMAIGSIGPAIAEGIAIARAMTAIAQQPDEASTISRTLFVGLAMIESTAIYCLVVSIILIFANPFWNHALANGYAIVSKDNDFRQRAFVSGPPPKVVWLAVGNAGTTAIADLLRSRVTELMRFDAAGEESLLALEPGAKR